MQPRAWGRAMTSLQEEPPAQAPCTSTTLRAGAGRAGCANACAVMNIAQTMPRAITVNFRSLFIGFRLSSFL